MTRRKKTDWFEEACAHVVGEVARGLGKRLRTAIETPKPKLPLAAQGPYQDATKPGVAPPTINVFQGPTQVVVNKKRNQSPERKRRVRSAQKRTPNPKVVDVEFKVKP